MGSIKGVQTLKTKKEFERVYKQGRSYHTPFFVLFFLPSHERRLGFIASKKVGKATKRNRAKRVLRALVVEHFDSLPMGILVLVAKPKILECEYKKLSENFRQLVKRVKRSI